MLYRQLNKKSILWKEYFGVEISSFFCQIRKTDCRYSIKTLDLNLNLNCELKDKDQDKD